MDMNTETNTDRGVGHKNEHRGLHRQRRTQIEENTDISKETNTTEENTDISKETNTDRGEHSHEHRDQHRHGHRSEHRDQH